MSPNSKTFFILNLSKMDINIINASCDLHITPLPPSRGDFCYAPQTRRLSGVAAFKSPLEGGRGVMCRSQLALIILEDWT